MANVLGIDLEEMEKRAIEAKKLAVATTADNSWHWASSMEEVADNVLLLISLVKLQQTQSFQHLEIIESLKSQLPKR